MLVAEKRKRTYIENGEHYPKGEEEDTCFERCTSRDVEDKSEGSSDWNKGEETNSEVSLCQASLLE